MADEPKFTFAWDNEAAVARINNMLKQLEQLPQKVADEFWTWQIEDMNRNRPHIIHEGRNRMYTHFWSNPRFARKRFLALREG